MGVIIVREMVGTSPTSWSDAARQAVALAEGQLFLPQGFGAGAEGGSPGGDAGELSGRVGRIHRGDVELWQAARPGLAWIGGG